MKRFWLVNLGICFLFSINAHAGVSPKPVAQAALTISHTDGAMKDTDRLSITMARTEDGAVFFLATGLRGIGKDGQVISMRTISSITTRCQSKIYSAYSHSLNSRADGKHEYLILQLTDHSTRKCKDRPQHRWNTVIQHVLVAMTQAGVKAETLGKIRAGGNPMPVPQK